jgi:hypothetical protein
MTPDNSALTNLTNGTKLMAVGVLLFLAYAVAFLFNSLSGDGFEIGVHTLNGVTPADLNAINPAIMAYMNHLHVAISGFIMSTSVAVLALVWFGVQRGLWWAWWTAMIAPVVALVIALPLHYSGTFEHNWVTHIGPVYIGTLIFVVGGLMAGAALMRTG